MQWRTTAMFAAGAIVGGAAVLAAYLTYFAPDVPRNTVYSGADMPAAPAALPAAQPVSATPPVAGAQVSAAGTCPAQAVAPAAAPGDGQFQLSAALAAQPRPDASAFLAVAREASGQGRQRDAEVAYIAACHVAERATGAQSTPVADIKSRLGQLYVLLAGHETPEEERQVLLQRASALFAQSTDAYAAALGRNASKTRMAAQRLAALRDPAVPMPRAEPLVVAAPDADADAAPDTSQLGSARLSLAERPPARTEDLGQIGSDLERLYTQARSVSRDPAGVERRHQQALAQRQACRDEPECLRQWAAQRKRQLFGEF